MIAQVLRPRFQAGLQLLHGRRVSHSSSPDAPADARFRGTMPQYPVAPGDVHATLSRHLLALGHSFVLDLEKSSGPFVRDAKSDREFLDFASFYASNPLGFAPSALTEPAFQERLLRAGTLKVANPDFYTSY